MSNRKIEKKIKNFMRRKPFKQVKTIEEADLFLIFNAGEIERITLKLKKDKDVSGITSLPNIKIFYFKSTNPRDTNLTTLGFINKTSIV